MTHRGAVMDVGDFLGRLGLQQYEALFRNNGIDARVLPMLTPEDLKDLGIRMVGHRRVLIEAIAEIRGPAATADKTGAAVVDSGQTRGAPTNTAAEAERRQVTVMFCDLVGSTELGSRLDPEDLREVIGRCQACIARIVGRFEGFVAKYMGDGVLAYFGYPHAHEDDAEQAVRAGLALVDAVGEVPAPQYLRIRVGIATGLVIVGDLIGDGSAQERAIIGETPNLAARLQALAEPNAIVVAESTRRQIGARFEVTALGPQSLKGFPAPQRAWQVLSENWTLGRFEALRSRAMPMIGRDRELNLLLRRWEQAKAGSGRVVLISAEPGVGKSRLAEALGDRLVGEQHIRLRYFCSPHHLDSAFFPIIAQMERAAGFAREDSPDEKRAKLRALLAAAARSIEDVALISELHALPGGECAPSLNVSLQRRKEKICDALLGQIERLSSQRPVLIVFEDIHWIDPSSRELLNLTVKQVRSWPVLLLATFRPEVLPSWAGEPHVTTLALTGLNPNDTAAMVTTIAHDAPLSTEIVREIAERTDGVPLFVEELTKAVLESGAQGVAALDAVPHWALSVPATLHASLMARLDRLGAAAKDVAQAGAVIGREFWHELLEAVTDLAESELRQALDRLTDAGLLFARGTALKPSYMFKHALVQETAYWTLLRSRRQDLHCRIAELLEARFSETVETQPELLAHHFAEADLAERAVEYWLKAGRHALVRSGMAEAEALLRKGLSSVANLPDDRWRRERELDLQIVLGKVLMAAYGFGSGAVGEVYSRAHHLCNELNRLDRLLPVLWGRWVHHLEQGDLGTAGEIANQMCQLGDAQGDGATRVMGLCASGSTCVFLGEFSRARDYVERGMALYEPAFRSAHAEPTAVDVAVDLLGNLTWSLACLGYLDQARSRSESMLAEARRLSHAHTLGFALWWGWVARWLTRAVPESSLEYADELLALSTEHGFAFLHAVALVHRGWSLAALDRANDGIPLLSEGLTGFRAAECVNPAPPGLTMLADAERLAGRPQSGLAYLAEAERIAGTTRIMYVEAETLRLRGELLSASGDLAETASYYGRSIALARRQGAKLFELRSSVGLARLWYNQGKRAEARALLTPIYEWFTEGFDAPDLVDAKVLLHELT